MELKNAAGVCLISFFAATLVVLIARWMDNRTADRLEPHLAAIAEELRAMRRQGPPAAAPSESRPEEPIAADPDTGLIVYYFHGKTRCPTCRAIESQAREVVQSHFADELSAGKLVWKEVNYESPAGAKLKDAFDVHISVVVLALMKDGQIERWTRLDRVWAVVGDKPAYEKYVREEIEKMLQPHEPTEPNIPLPDEPAFPEFQGSTT